MHGLTPISITGAVTSLLVSPLLLWVIWRARRHQRFLVWPYVGALAFESLFLVGYMTFLSFEPGRSETITDPWDVGLGAAHGVLALVVFVGYWALLPVAARQYQRGRNLFAERAWLTWSATTTRALALLTGEAIFVLHIVQ